MARQVFTASGTFTVPAGITKLMVMIVAGGGGGGRAGSSGAGGSGGQVRFEVIDVAPAQTFTVTVGNGGAGRSGSTGAGANGQDSVFGTYTAIGGGAGAGGAASTPTAGAYGGGAQSATSGSYTGATGLVAYRGGDGYPGESGGTGSGGGGGGGAGGNGMKPHGTAWVYIKGGDGGRGLNMSNYFGTDVGQDGWFGGGGGGGTNHMASVTATPGFGGMGGGGDGTIDTDLSGGHAGLANTGGGGGGGNGSAEGGTDKTTDGGNGGSGVVIVGWGDLFSIPTAGQLTSPVGRWVKPTYRPIWHDGTNWGAILPTVLGHALFSNLRTGESLRIVDSRQNTRPTTVFYDNKLGVMRASSSQTRFSLYDASNNYEPIIEDAVVPLTSSDRDAAPMALAVTPNGYLWAAVADAGVVRVSRSTNNGASWTSAQAIATMTQPTGAVTLAVVDTTLILFASENDAAGDARYVRSIAQGRASYASVLWQTESLPSLPAGVTADDHVASTVLPDGRMLVVAKNTVSTNTDLIYVLTRSVAGVWSKAAVLENGPDALGYTRPNITVAGQEVYVFYGSYVTPRDLFVRSANISDLTIWTPRATTRTDGDWGDSASTPVTVPWSEPTFPVIAHEVLSGGISVEWQSYLPDSSTIKPIPVGEYGFNEGTGGVGFDVSGNNYHATVTTWAEGHTSNSAVGNSTRHAGSILAPLLPDPYAGFTFMSWVYPTAGGTLFAAFDDNDMSAWGLELSGTELRVWVNDIAEYNPEEYSSIAISLHEWVHLALVVNEYGWTLYVNGIEAAVWTTFNPLYYLSTHRLTFGGSNDTGSYNTARVDDLRVFNAAMSLENVEYFRDTPVVGGELEPEPETGSGVSIALKQSGSVVVYNATHVKLAGVKVPIVRGSVKSGGVLIPLRPADLPPETP